MWVVHNDTPANDLIMTENNCPLGLRGIERSEFASPDTTCMHQERGVL